MTPEQKLAALFAADAPPARDYGFQTLVAGRIAARRAWLTVLALTPWAIASAALLWALQPMIHPLSQGLAAVIGPLASILAIASVAGFSALQLSRRVSRRFSAG
ncbi:hypothetical protein [Brevundimonas sp. Root1279]|uniref:hypothetical protein n=1 Tax=Brevundimonas sp. Root1279 TaxID=1736443 RepID=UPI0006F2C14B|nr:hypothetical protein [Brevundimonas sp. Root1279]KQW79846.1 hypothetical protein ASC65_14995 [Brevundimonas sp. Root1279]